MLKNLNIFLKVILFSIWTDFLNFYYPNCCFFSFSPKRKEKKPKLNLCRCSASIVCCHLLPVLEHSTKLGTRSSVEISGVFCLSEPKIYISSRGNAGIFLNLTAVLSVAFSEYSCSVLLLVKHFLQYLLRRRFEYHRRFEKFSWVENTTDCALLLNLWSSPVWNRKYGFVNAVRRLSSHRLW